ncbi:MAG: DUF2784 domain-containing protein [Alphaproteobacteria bacterium]|uniref:DUF2784 domain-containing protein n=1 Tax=Candidatus Nitrobium versatile TaxID=2884831 RepID=A0A953M1X6_9BACT|nr:DUF2784 domain-containing protein [Candidatus Nitrobium versatile]
MLYRILADGVVFIHFLWILFLIFGAFWGVRFRAVRILHLSGLAFAVGIQVFGWYCPLTHLEVWLRARHDPLTTYTGSFISYYLEKIIYLHLPGSVLFALTLLLSGFNGWVYLRKKR